MPREARFVPPEIADYRAKRAGKEALENARLAAIAAEDSHLNKPRREIGKSEEKKLNLLQLIKQ
jgi:cytosine/adenosine deaminase-related metal-dependent hydrolase